MGSSSALSSSVNITNRRRFSSRHFGAVVVDLHTRRFKVYRALMPAPECFRPLAPSFCFKGPATTSAWAEPLRLSRLPGLKLPFAIIAGHGVLQNPTRAFELASSAIGSASPPTLIAIAVRKPPPALKKTRRPGLSRSKGGPVKEAGAKPRDPGAAISGGNRKPPYGRNDEPWSAGIHTPPAARPKPKPRRPSTASNTLKTSLGRGPSFC